MSIRAEVDEVSKDIRMYKTMTGAKINRDKSIGGLAMTGVEIRQYTLRTAFLDGMCSQSDGNNEF